MANKQGNEMGADFYAIVGLLLFTGFLNAMFIRIIRRVEALERAVRKLNPGLNI